MKIAVTDHIWPKIRQVPGIRPDGIFIWKSSGKKNQIRSNPNIDFHDARSFDYFADEDSGGRFQEESNYSNALLKSFPASSDHLRSQAVMSREELVRAYRQQVQIEMQDTVYVKSIVADQYRVGDNVKILMQDLEQEWRERLTKLISEKRMVRSRLATWEKTKLLNKYVFMSHLPVAGLVDIILSEALNLIYTSETFSLSSSQLCMKLGEQVMNAYFLHNKLHKSSYYGKEISQAYSRYLDWYVEPAGKAKTHRAAMLKACGDFGLKHAEFRWPDHIITMVGRELKNFLLQELHVTRDRNGEIVANNRILSGTGFKEPALPLYSNPAFFKVYRTRKDHEVQETKPHPILVKLHEKSDKAILRFSPIDVPMICPPVPWISRDTGAFIYRSKELVRVSFKDCPTVNFF